MTELEAVNMMLRAIGVRRVNELTSDQPDVTNARSILKRLRKKVQRRGWWFNIDYNVTYTPDGSSELSIGEDVTTLVFEKTRYVRRGTRVYDKHDQTYKIEEPLLVCRQITVVPWDEMPEACADHIAYYSAAEFIRDEIEDLTKKKDFLADAALALTDLKKQDIESQRLNIFSRSRVAAARSGVQPYSRQNRRYFTGTPDK